MTYLLIVLKIDLPIFRMVNPNFMISVVNNEYLD